MARWLRQIVACVLVLGTLVQSVYGGMALICIGCKAGAVALERPRTAVPPEASCCDGCADSDAPAATVQQAAGAAKPCGCDDAACNCFDIQSKDEPVVTVVKRDVAKLVFAAPCHDIAIASSAPEFSPSLQPPKSTMRAAIPIEQARIIARSVVLLI